MSDATDYEVTGFRFIDSDYGSLPSVGDVLPNSYQWDGDEITDDELDGTCAFATREAVERYAQYSRGCGWIVRIGGENMGYDPDLADGILIGNATVLDVQEW